MLNPLKDKFPIPSVDRCLAKTWLVCRTAAAISLVPLFAVTAAESAIVALAVVVVSVAFFPVWYFGHSFERSVKQRRAFGDR